MKKLKEKDILINYHLTDDFLDEVLDIIYEAFKLKIINLKLFTDSKEKAIHIYKKSINKDLIITALDGDAVMGVLGLHKNSKKCIKFQFDTLKKEFGLWGGFYRYCISLLDNIKLNPDELRIELITVKKSMRGRGIGTLLLNEVFTYAQKKGFRYLLLEVVDTNSQAQRLYESLGYKIYKKKKWGFLTKKAGFTYEYRMKKELPKDHPEMFPSSL